MRKTAYIPLLVAFAAFGFSPPLPAADGDPEKEYRELFGPMAKKIAASPEKEDDAELAALFLEEMASLKGREAFKTFVYLKACAFAVAARDWDTAERAVDALVATAPDRTADWERKRLEIRRTRYALSRGAQRRDAAAAYVTQLIAAGDAARDAGDYEAAADDYRKAASLAAANRLPGAEAARARLTAVGRERNRRRRIAQLEKQLAARPDSSGVRKRLVMEYVLGLDDPAAAAQYLDADDLALKTCVDLAARPPEQLDEESCRELAEWYRDLAAGQPPDRKTTARRRAITYYRRYLAGHGATDVAGLKARQELEKLEVLTAAAGPPALPAGAVFHLGFNRKDVLRKGARRYLKNLAADGDAPGALLPGPTAIVDTGDWGAEAAQFTGAETVSTDGDEMSVSGAAGTIAVWVRPADTRGTRSIFHTEERRDRMLWTHAGRFRATMFTGARFETLTGGIVDRSWHHLAFSWDIGKGILLFYVDGRPVDSRKGPAWTIVTRDRPTGYGGPRPAEINVPPRAGFVGLIDEAAVWKRVLKPAAVAQLYRPR